MGHEIEEGKGTEACKGLKTRLGRVLSSGYVFFFLIVIFYFTNYYLHYRQGLEMRLEPSLPLPSLLPPSLTSHREAAITGRQHNDEHGTGIGIHTGPRIWGWRHVRRISSP